MANGDAAAAAGMDVVAATANRAMGYDEINKSRDYIAQRTSAVTPVLKGGTGATTASAARTNLDVPSNADLTAGLATKAPAGYTPASLASGAGSLAWNGSDRWNSSGGYGAGGLIEAVGNIITHGSFYTYGASIATSGWTACFINSDGRVTKGASSSRWKKDINRTPTAFGFVDLITSYKMRADEAGVTRYGPIVEDMVKVEQAAPLVNFDEKNLPESFDQFSFLMACIAELTARVKELEAERDGSAD